MNDAMAFPTNYYCSPDARCRVNWPTEKSATSRKRKTRCLISIDTISNIINTLSDQQVVWLETLSLITAVPSEVLSYGQSQCASKLYLHNGMCSLSLKFFEGEDAVLSEFLFLFLWEEFLIQFKAYVFLIFLLFSKSWCPNAFYIHVDVCVVKLGMQ